MDEPAQPLIEYPTTYFFKVMGRREPEFQALVGSLFAEVMGEALLAEAITENASQGGTYVSLTVSVVLDSEDRRQRLYAALHREKRVLYYL